MLLYFFNIQLQECNNYNVLVPDTLPAGLEVLLTHDGFTKYARKNIDFMQAYVQNLVIKDMIIEVAGFMISLMDFAVMRFDLSNFDSQFINGGGYGKLENISIKFKMNFKIQQTMYPYLQDSGQGIFLVSGFNIQTFIKPYMDKKCKYHFAIYIENATTSLDSLQITLDGKMAFIYDAILRVLTDKLVDMFNTNIGADLVKGIQDIANNAIYDQADVTQTSLTMHANDQRIKDVKVDPDFIYCNSFSQQLFIYNNVTTPGVKENYFDADHNIVIIPHKQFYTNAHIQYHVNINVYQSILNNYVTSLEKKLIKNETTLILNSTPKIKKFVNMGAILEINFTNVRVEYLVKFQSGILFGFDTYNFSQFLIQVSEGHQLQCITSTQSLCTQVIPKFIKFLNDYLHKAPILYVNGNGIQYCETQVYQDDWLLASCYLEKKRQQNE